MVGPAAKRRVVNGLTQRGACSERRACTMLDAHRSTVRRAKRVPSDEGLLRKRIGVLAKKYVRYGYRRIANELRKEGWRVNSSSTVSIRNLPPRSVRSSMKS